MTLPITGPISIKHIKDEFDLTTPTGMQDLYVLGIIPSGQIGIGDFRGTAKYFTVQEQLMYSNSADAQHAIATTVPPSVNDLFTTWPRYFGADYFEDASTATGSAANWELLTDPERVSQPDNTALGCGIVSPFGLDTYHFEATVTSPGADDDSIGLVIAFVRDGDINKALLAVRTKGGNHPTLGWGLLYCEYGAANTWLINNIDVDGVSGDGGFSGDQSRISVDRDGDIITCLTTNWNDVNNFQPSSQIVLDLNSDPRLHIFKGKQPYGYYTLSQAGSTYLDVEFSGGLDSPKIIDNQAGQVWEYIDGSWTLTTESIIEQFDPIKKVINQENGELFLITPTSSTFLGQLTVNSNFDSNKVQAQSQMIIASTVNDSAGAISGTQVIGLYKQYQEQTNLLAGKPLLYTTSDHNYEVHETLGNTGYNNVGGPQWFSTNNIDVTPHNLIGGTVVFDNGIVGVITEISDGDSTTSSKIYYNATTDFQIFGMSYTVSNVGAMIIYSDQLDTDYYGPSSQSQVSGVESNKIFIELYQNTLDDTWSIFIVCDTVAELDSGSATVDITNLPVGHTISMSDDATEVVEVDSTTARGTWSWGGANTDGGIIRCPNKDSINGVTLTLVSTNRMDEWKFRTPSGYAYQDINTPFVFGIG